ncbi:TonB-dependent receptor [Marinimicrobium alkaliphilum]|uniref:TonB-dependent receptor n=1 Tax=Marinimicrobium alkaliphilum TaxID=2202654 RepID=UPI000DBA235D|nr:TonB-dependent receptor [Marinimicrobium alkaliphilum]
MFKRTLLSSSVAAVVALAAQPTFAQDEAILEEVIVTGIRGSLNRAIDIKRDSMSVVDSIVAEDIGKLPDNNVVESLQRVAGVQVTDRGTGEVNAVLIRGLPDVSTTVNGRTMFTGTGRALALADIPSTLVSRIDVSKSRSADQYENGIAGTIDVRTFRPFDFDGSRVSLAGRAIHQERAETTDPVLSALFSNRWETNAGEFGALLNVSTAKTRYRDQTMNAGAAMPFFTENPASGFAPLEIIRPDTGGGTVWEPGLDRGLPTAPGSTLVVAGEEVPYYLARDALIINDFTGERERHGANLSLQFAPNDRTEYTFEAFYNGFRNESFNNMYFSFVDWWGSLGGLVDDRDEFDSISDTFNLYPGTNIIRDRTIRDGFNFTSGDYSRGKTDSYLFALGGKWELTDNLNIESEIVYQQSDFETQFFAMRGESVRPEIRANFDGRPGIEFFEYDGTPKDLTDPSEYAMGPIWNNAGEDSGEAMTFTVDGEYWTDIEFLPRVAFGFRWDDRNTATRLREQASNRGCEAAVNDPDRETSADIALCDFASYDDGLHHINSDFMKGRATAPRSWVVASGPYLRDNRDSFLNLYDMPTDVAMRQTFEVDERNAALYATADFETHVAGRLLDGQVGLRYVDVETDNVFFDQAGNPTTESTTTNSEMLPSLMLRYHINDEWLLRAAYSETLRMPGFNDLNPNITYNDDLSNVGYGTANSGNANLAPTTSQNLDLSLEWYFGDASYAYLTLFQRSVDGLVIPFRERIQPDADDIPDGFLVDTFVWSRPDNASDGTLQGVELGFTYFPENLPEQLDGLGVITSATFLDSEQTIPVFDETGQPDGEMQVPFFGVSDFSYSITAAYERPTFDVRLSYVWRDTALNRNEAALFANPLRIYRQPEESLDFQFSYNVTDELTVTFDATNLTEQFTQERYGDSAYFSHVNTLFSRTFALGARYSF